MTTTRAPGPSAGSWLRWAAAVGLLAVTLAHPSYSTDAAGELQRISAAPDWLAVHLGLLAAIALFDLSLLSWPGPGRTLPRRLRGLGVAIHLCAYSAFLGVDGIAGGLIAEGSRQAPGSAQPGLAAAEGLLFRAPAVGWLAVLAGIGWLLAVGTIFVGLLDRPRLLPAVGLLLAGAIALTFSHSPPVGPIGAGLAVAAAAALDAGMHRRSG